MPRPMRPPLRNGGELRLRIELQSRWERNDPLARQSRRGRNGRDASAAVSWASIIH
jgi:hypothetical protein